MRFSFPLFETELPEKDYFYQAQVYMHLTGKKKASGISSFEYSRRNIPVGSKARLQQYSERKKN